MAFAKVRDRLNALVAAELLNDRGTEYCGSQWHVYGFYLEIEDIDLSKTKAKRPQSNGIFQRRFDPGHFRQFALYTFVGSGHGVLQVDGLGQAGVLAVAVRITSDADGGRVMQEPVE